MVLGITVIDYLYRSIFIEIGEGTGEGQTLHPLMPYPSMIQRKSEGG